MERELEATRGQDRMITNEAMFIVKDCLEMMAEAKSTLVHLDGIGSELLPSIVAWDGTTSIGYAMTTNPYMKTEHLNKAMGEVAGLMLEGWGATGLALVTEGYAREAMEEDESDCTNLAERFPHDRSVREALWVAYVGMDGDTCTGVMCFTQEVGRVVTYDDPMISDEDTRTFEIEGTLPHSLFTAFSRQRHPASKRTVYTESWDGDDEVSDDVLLNEDERTAMKIHKLGFSVYLDGHYPWISPTTYPDVSTN